MNMKVAAKIYPVRECDYNFNTWFAGEYKSKFSKIVRLVFPRPEDFDRNYSTIVNISNPIIRDVFLGYPEFVHRDKDNVSFIAMLIDERPSESELILDIEYTTYTNASRLRDLLVQYENICKAKKAMELEIEELSTKLLNDIK